MFGEDEPWIVPLLVIVPLAITSPFTTQPLASETFPAPDVPEDEMEPPTVALFARVTSPAAQIEPA